MQSLHDLSHLEIILQKAHINDVVCSLLSIEIELVYNHTMAHISTRDVQVSPEAEDDNTDLP